LRVGAIRSKSPLAELAKVDALVKPLQSYPFDDAAAYKYAEVRVDLEARGFVVGDFDLMIAAIALAHNLILVTHNTKDFINVPGLQLEDWELP